MLIYFQFANIVYFGTAAKPIWDGYGSHSTGQTGCLPHIIPQRSDRKDYPHILKTIPIIDYFSISFSSSSTIRFAIATSGYNSISFLKYLMASFLSPLLL